MLSGAMIKNYYQLVKPGIIYGNLLTMSGGFILASRGYVNLALLVATALGVALVIGAGCVYNNIIDTDIDKVMKRTKKRALVVGTISKTSAVAYASVLVILGFIVLSLRVNMLTAAVGLVGIFFYVVVYGLAKRRTPLSTLIGTVAGAAPVVAGYTAVTNSFDTTAFILFLILVFWQMPHFYAIAIYRLEDYKDAGLPVLPVRYGLRATKIHILFFIILFIIACASLSILGYASKSFVVVMGGLALYWFGKGLGGFNTRDSTQWAHQMFGVSLIIILMLSIMLSINSFLV
ncbi:MAG TPA: heme o synthase [Gammaproteobacteria bacterium]|nr:heme o synthase [Gammaproteobacteria bacterium]